MKSHLRILHVEDSEDDATLVQRALKAGGLNASYTRVYDAASFSRALDETVWDLVISDFRMPSFDGLAALHILKERALEIPFIIVSGTIGEETAVEVMKAGASDYIMKDKLKRLAPAVQRELEQFRVKARLRESEQQFQQAQKMEAVGRLAGGIAHDFNNILGVILMYCDLIRDRLAAEDPSLKDVEQIKKAGERAKTLTRQLLAFSRKQILEPRIVDLNPVLVDLEKMLSRLIGADVELDSELDPDLLRIKIDAGQLEQVIINLVVNSRDAMPKGGRISIKTRNVVIPESDELARKISPGSYVCISVVDNGCGMDAATQKRMFEPFFTTKGLDKGTGLGLSIVFGVVQQSGGHVLVDSKLGEGTQFHIYLPASTLPPEPSEASFVPIVSNPPDVQGQKILVIEDEPDLRAVIAMTLSRQGYEIADPVLPKQAIEYSNAGKPIDLLISDVIMPEVSGPELASQLLEKHPALKILLMSGYLDDTLERFEGVRERMHFIQKPFSSEQLIRKVRGILSTGKIARSDIP